VRKIPHFSYSVEYMKTPKKSSRTSSNGRRKSAAVVQPSPAAHVRRPERVIHFLTQDELRRLFKGIKSKRDRAIFLVAYRHGLRASEIGLLLRTDVDVKQGRISIHRVSA
jgi:integrase